MPCSCCAVRKASSRRWNAPMRSRYAAKLAPTSRQDQIIVVNLSGRGDKDVCIDHGLYWEGESLMNPTSMPLLRDSGSRERRL